MQFYLLLCIKLLREDCWVMRMAHSDYWNCVGYTKHFVMLKQTTQRTFTDMWSVWLSLLQGMTFGCSVMLDGIVLMFLSSLCSVLLLFLFLTFSLGGNRQHLRLTDPGNVGIWCLCLAIRLWGNLESAVFVHRKSRSYDWGIVLGFTRTCHCIFSSALPEAVQTKLGWQ